MAESALFVAIVLSIVVHGICLDHGRIHVHIQA
jgi:hypothetical protein